MRVLCQLAIIQTAAVHSAYFQILAVLVCCHLNSREQTTYSSPTRAIRVEEADMSRDLLLFLA